MKRTPSDLYGSDGDVLIMFLPLASLTSLPYKEPSKGWYANSDLGGMNGIEELSSVAGRSPPAGHTFCKIKAGVTNDQFRRWCFDKKTWCIPFNVIMVEVTFGGTNAPICHGSGLGSTTLSDLVVEVRYIDAHGNVQTVNDPAELRAASGCFGLLGVVTAVTLQLDTMSVAEMAPVKTHIALAIPPPEGYNIPREVRMMMKKSDITKKKLDAARAKFIERVEGDYYLEWFWFPYQTQCWVNTWKSAFNTTISHRRLALNQ